LVPAFDKGENNFNMLINELNNKGSLEQVFKASSPVVIPNLTELTGKKTNMNYLFIPISEGKKKRGLVSILTSASEIGMLIKEINAVNLCLGMAVDKAELLLKKEELKSVYDELQLYQSKLTNDYKLLAIGELTSGIVEDVLSPLQVILSYTEFLNQENGVDEEIPVSIKKQVQKVETIIDRLVKFASINDGKAKIQPCDLNEHITGFYEMIASSLRNDNYECVLDLEKNIPSIISHPVHLNQLLSNLFTLVKASGTSAGGILIQTRCSKETVTLRVLSTDYIESLDKSVQQDGQDINFGIIKNLTAKQDGEIRAESSRAAGTNIILSFPLKRKII
jgi:signal transduction histidine kinase